MAALYHDANAGWNVIEVIDLVVRQGAFALDRVSFTVPAGEYAVLMGKSGSGKTTTLEALAGLRSATSGTIRFAGRDVTQLPPAARHVGYVPQDGVLFDTMTVRENLGFALNPGEGANRIHELAEQLELTHLLDRWPPRLSGGEKQRVALGRALAFRPPVLLLDEPLGALDDDTRDHLIGHLMRLKERREATVLHVTHNRSEAERLADRVFKLDTGRFAE